MGAQNHHHRRIKGSWSPQEDVALVKLVEEHGPRNWAMICTGIPGRSGKSCRLRWCNQLCPEVHHRPFTPEEDDVILRAHILHGNKWATIARLLPGRTDNAVKNYWNCTLCRKRQPEAAAKSSSPTMDSSNCKPATKRQNPSDESESDIRVVSKKRRRLNGGDKDEKPVGPKTSLTLSLLGETAVPVPVRKKEVEETPSEDDDDDDREEEEKKMAKETGLLSIMQRMIAAEVRRYIDTLRAQNGLEPDVSGLEAHDVQ